ncbi:MAG TPA: FAD-dependent oxidoreductase [Candidatus Sulfotelmatobacter sp.]|jgi:FAD binding domain/Berberine and berberine like|nr:FAD-dependent oxidoreductase [Candidatus Sulfotelmatobacter sp.]
MIEASEEVYSSLHRRFKGDLVRPSDSGYEDTRAIWNAMVARAPGIIARCADVSDVQSTIRAASETGILAAIRCGGHSLAGFSTCDGGLVIDLSRMRQVTVDPEARRARVAGGCLLGSIDTATQKAGLVFPSGVVSHTGASGLILGGGTGWLTRRFGLSCDNVAGFTLVTADSSLVRANLKENPDLFWALRGGGGNFGVVTEFELKLHLLTSVVLAEGLTPEPKIRGLLECWRDFMAEAPIDLKWNIDLRLAPHREKVPHELRGHPVAGSSLIWTGDPEAGRPHLQRALSLCSPDSVSSKIVPFLKLQTMADADFPHGRRYYTKSGYFSYLDNSSIDRLLEALAAIPSSETQIELAYLGGAAARIGADETAFGDRSSPFILNLLANWSEPSADACNVAWIRGIFHKLRPSMKPGVYINFMSGDEQDRVPEAYHERWDRIVAVKSHYDPNNFFRLNQNIAPRKPVAGSS